MNINNLIDVENFTEHERNKEILKWKVKKYDELVYKNINLSSNQTIDNELIIKVEYSDMLCNDSNVFLGMLIEKIMKCYKTK